MKAWLVCEYKLDLQLRSNIRHFVLALASFGKFVLNGPLQSYKIAQFIWYMIICKYGSDRKAIVMQIKIKKCQLSRIPASVSNSNVNQMTKPSASSRTHTKLNCSPPTSKPVIKGLESWRVLVFSVGAIQMAGKMLLFLLYLTFYGSTVSEFNNGRTRGFVCVCFNWKSLKIENRTIYSAKDFVLRSD